MGYIIGLMLMLNFFVIDDVFGIEMLGLMMGGMMAVTICSSSTIRGKETLMIYRKIPSGVERFMKAKLLQGFLLVLPFIAGVMVAGGLRFNVLTSTPFLISIGKALLISMATVILVTGLSLFNPAYSQKSTAYFINFQAAIFLIIGFTIIPDKILHQPWLQIPMAWVIGLIMIYLGYRKLSTIE